MMRCLFLALQKKGFTTRVGPNNSFKPTPHRGVGHVPALR